LSDITGSGRIKAKAYNIQGLILFDRKKYTESETLFLRALQLNINNEDVLAVAANYHNLARVKIAQGDEAGGLNHLKSSLLYDKRAENFRGVAQDLRSIGFLYMGIGKKDIAFRYLKRAFHVNLFHKNFVWASSDLEYMQNLKMM